MERVRRWGEGGVAVRMGVFMGVSGWEGWEVRRRGEKISFISGYERY